MPLEWPTILVLGSSGLLGNMVFRVLSEDSELRVFGTIRSTRFRKYFVGELESQLITVQDLTSLQVLQELLEKVKPNIVINCISVGRPIPSALELLLPLLSVLPQHLSYLCDQMDIRLVQISSDGVFSGRRGGYSEGDVPDAQDAYGVAKLLGEVRGNALTLRTSLLGPELEGKSGLLEWFLSQSSACKGYSMSVFSGITTLEFAKFLREVIIPSQDLSGVFHVASSPCSKLELLKMIALEYELRMPIVPDDSLRVDRSLSAKKHENITGYFPPGWGEMLYSMRNYKFGLRVDI